jgi:hypothetical protein
MFYNKIVFLILLIAILSYKLWTLNKKENFEVPPRHKLHKPKVKKPSFKNIFSGLKNFIKWFFKGFFKIIKFILIAGIYNPIVDLINGAFYFITRSPSWLLQILIYIVRIIRSLIEQIITIFKNLIFMIIGFPNTILNIIIGLQNQLLGLSTKAFSLPFINWFFK